MIIFFFSYRNGFIPSWEKEDAIQELRTPYHKLSADTINYFIYVVNHSTNYRMANTHFIIDTDVYKHFMTTTDDSVQILIDPESSHWTCIFYKSEAKEVLVYDSLLLDRVKQKHIDIIVKLYHIEYESQIKLVKPMTTQREIGRTDDTSCGAFAMAYAATVTYIIVKFIVLYLIHCNLQLIRGKDPRSYPLQLNRGNEFNGDQSMHLRQHIIKILNDGTLSLFPKGISAPKPAPSLPPRKPSSGHAYSYPSRFPHPQPHPPHAKPHAPHTQSYPSHPQSHFAHPQKMKISEEERKKNTFPINLINIGNNVFKSAIDFVNSITQKH